MFGFLKSRTGLTAADVQVLGEFAEKIRDRFEENEAEIAALKAEVERLKRSASGNPDQT